jgi:hypothetical protein
MRMNVPSDNPVFLAGRERFYYRSFSTESTQSGPFELGSAFGSLLGNHIP